ncbi:MAG: IS66 family insertion sequence element accessory protein TnpB, partial [Aureliella sp.]
MIHFAHGLKVFICTEPTDMRRSFDGLSGMVQSVLNADPLSGHLFLFRNRARDSIKILYWDGDGLALWYKNQEEQAPRRFLCTRLSNQAHNIGIGTAGPGFVAS